MRGDMLPHESNPVSQLAQQSFVLRRGRLLAAATLLAGLMLSGCAANRAPAPLDMPADLLAVQSAVVDDVTVSVSILTDEQAARHFGVDLAKHEVQVLWVRVHNASPRQLWFIRNILDPDFYSADEVALLARAQTSRERNIELRGQLRDDTLRVSLAPRTETEGFVYLPRAEGGRYLDIRLQADAYSEGVRLTTAEGAASAAAATRELRFEFAMALPDGHFDFERLDPERTYAGRTLPDLELDVLRRELEALPCCASNEKGDGEGDPLNIVLVGDANQVLHSLSRSGWSFTHRIDFGTIRREIGAAIAGESYAVAPVSDLYAFGRSQDVSLQRARRSISRRNHMRLWLAPFRFEGRSIWVGQVSRDIGVKLTTKSPTLTTHVIDPEVDATREYLLHSLIAQGFVDRFGFAKGSGAGTPVAPRLNLTDDPYFSDGMRLVVILAAEPVRPDQIRSLLWEQSAAPIAEGQTDAALRRVRPIAAETHDPP